MAVGFIRWLQCADAIPIADGIAITIGNDVIAPLRREAHPVSRRNRHGAGVKHQQMIVETTCCARENMRMRCTMGAR
jgi:hypothetical protein